MIKRVLAVDDSAFARKLIKEILNSSGQLTVVDTATNGSEALAKLERVCPDVITLDVEMPVMNGLETLARIMEVRPTPVVMLSSLTTEGAEISMAALELGAVDVAAKPIAHGLPQLRSIADELLVKVLTASRVDPRLLARRSAVPRAPVPSMRRSVVGAALPVVVIASSTGGPRALRDLIPRIPTRHSAFYMLVQHLPAGFTAVMARDLDKMTPLQVREAVEGDSPVPDTVLVAPAGKHSEFRRGGRITLTEDPPLWGVRPAADVTMLSAAAVFGARTIGVVLTGMGHDGTRGIGAVRSAGGRTIAEHESSCVVYGMPKSAIESGAVQKIAPLDDLPDVIASAVEDISRSAG